MLNFFRPRTPKSNLSTCSLSTAIGHLHQRGIIHKDIKPTNVLVNSVTGQ
jgi:serine/threonine protein kinase